MRFDRSARGSGRRRAQPPRYPCRRGRWRGVPRGPLRASVDGRSCIVPGLVLAAGMAQRHRARDVVRPSAHRDGDAAPLRRPRQSRRTGVTLWLSIGRCGGVGVGTELLHVLPHRTLRADLRGRCSRPRCGVHRRRCRRATAAHGGGTRLALVAVGTRAGIARRAPRVGGGVIMVPALILLFGVSPVVAKARRRR